MAKRACRPNRRLFPILWGATTRRAVDPFFAASFFLDAQKEAKEAPGGGTPGPPAMSPQRWEVGDRVIQDKEQAGPHIGSLLVCMGMFSNDHGKITQCHQQ